LRNKSRACEGRKGGDSLLSSPRWFLRASSKAMNVVASCSISALESFTFAEAAPNNTFPQHYAG
jgi:hypothetical protein